METPVASDAALASVAQGGDAEALAVLFERHRPSLYAAAVELLGTRVDALDAVQDTFVVALLRLADLRDANAAGVQASIVGVLASSELTVLEIDFSNPPTWPDHCLASGDLRAPASQRSFPPAPDPLPREPSPPNDSEHA